MGVCVYASDGHPEYAAQPCVIHMVTGEACLSPTDNHRPTTMEWHGMGACIYAGDSHPEYAAQPCV